jgi:hypothetical protein
MVNTKHVKDRRRLRFERLAEAVAEAERLATCEAGSSVRTAGNWTLGQTLGHLAYWANAAFEGLPDMRKPPWLMRVMLRFMKSSFLNKQLPAGVKIPHVPNGTFGTQEIPTEEGLRLMRIAYERLEGSCPSLPSPMLGPLTHEEWIKLNLRHAELHLSFFHA